MPQNKNKGAVTDIIAEAKKLQQEREKTYRERALKLFPHVCGRCGRELSGKKLKELTVHHKDHNHDNNPQDGSNWELLCIYCHDNEHSILTGEGEYGSTGQNRTAGGASTFKAFAGLDRLLKDRK
jgi:5-methylcytosine-specific restriction endonuclease McrA